MLRIALFLISSSLAHSATIVIVRHAERAGQMTSSEVPLSPEGEQRAIELARVLRDSKVGTIFVTDTKRTHDTAAPLGKALGITPVVLPARDTEQLAKKLLSLGASETALVVGHSNTVPAIVKALGSETPPMSDSEFDRMLVITTGGSKPAMLTLRYGR